MVRTEIDYLYLLKELKEDLEDGAEKIKEAYNINNKILEKIKDDKELKKVIENIEHSQEQAENNLKAVTHRKELLDLLFNIKLTVRDRFIISLLLEVFGQANTDLKSLEERIENKEDYITFNFEDE